MAQHLVSTGMRHWMAAGLLGGLAVGLLGCAASSPQPALPPVYRDTTITDDTLWAGQIVIDGTVRVAKQATLRIAPGTQVRFVRRDADADGLGDASLVVEGRLLAVGTRQQPIQIKSAEQHPQPGDWLEIRVDFSREVHLRYCEIRDSAYTLHAHFTRGLVEDCTIHDNIDGCRLGEATFTFRNNLIENNSGKGINFRNSRVEAHHNIIRHNGSGVFLFETDRPFDLRHNNIYGNLDNFRLGDFFTGDVSLQDNWWGFADPLAAQNTIFDQRKDPAIGTVAIQPQSAWIAGTGPRDALGLQPAWTYATEGYIDANLVADPQHLYVASWDGSLHVLDARGRQVWSKNLGDTVDSTPVLAGDLLAVQTWGREVYALQSTNGTVRWRFDYSPSRADDHRQGGLLLVDNQLLVPAWNGRLYALDSQSGDRRWSVDAGQPLRAKPAWDGRRIYLTSGSGTLSALSLAGELLWEAGFASPLLGEPTLTPQGVAVLSRDGEIAVFDPQGAELWRQDLDETCYYGSPVYANRALYVPTAAGALWKLDADSGQILWRVATHGPVYGTPLIAAGRVFLGDNSGHLQVIGADSAERLASYQVDREIQGRPLLWQGYLLFGSRDHRVHALRLVEQQVP
jgi:outer membrane protein assembly factor BamB